MKRWLPRVEWFEEDFVFVLPVLGFGNDSEEFAIGGGWLKWHVEISWDKGNDE